MKPKSLKSQVTMVMIIVIVMFVAVGIILYLSKDSIKKTLQQSTSKSQNSALGIQPIKEFVTKCLDKTAKDAVSLLGSQGGYLYLSQGGTLVDFDDTDQGLFFIRHNGLNVAYNIENPPLHLPSPYSSKAPDYPWQTFPYRSETDAAKNFLGIFGLSNLPPLIPSQGQHSIQSQIETYIDNHLAGCLDFKIFESQGYQITQSSSKTHVIIAAEDVKLASEIPLKLINTGTKETLELKDFSTTLNVRIKEMYYFVRSLIDRDIQDIRFNIKSQENNKNSFYITLFEDAYKKDDMVSIQDQKSIISGKPMEYIFARKNRGPALYYIKNANNLEFDEGEKITQEDLLHDQDINAEDPDEDKLTFKITPSLPIIINTAQIRFLVKVTDGEFSDYQYIIAKEK